GVIALLDGSGHLGGLIAGMGHDAVEGLLRIPRVTGVRLPHARLQAFQVVDGLAHRRFRLTSMIIGRLGISGSNIASCYTLEMSTVTSMVAVFSSLLVWVCSDMTSLVDADSTWVISRSNPDRS